MDKRISVLLCCRTLDIGGCERDVAKIALNLDRDVYAPHVACFYDEGFRAAELRSAGIPVACFPLRSLRSAGTLVQALAVITYLRRNNIRIVHAFDTPTNIFFTPVAKLAKIPGVISSTLWYRHMLDKRSLFLSRIIDRVVDKVVVNSAAVQRDLIEHENVPGSSIYLHYSGVDTQTFHSRDRTRVPEVANATLVIGTVCALRPEKRVELLVEAYSRLPSRDPSWRLLIVGSGDMKPTLMKQVEQLGITSETVFVESRPDVATYLRSMDIFVIPSYSESFPNALVEAMACGCCAIGSRVGGIPEAIVDGKTGLLFRSGDVDDLNEQLLSVASDPVMRRCLSDAAAHRAKEEFSLDAGMVRIQRLYETLLAT